METLPHTSALAAPSRLAELPWDCMWFGGDVTVAQLLGSSDVTEESWDLLGGMRRASTAWESHWLGNEWLVIPSSVGLESLQQLTGAQCLLKHPNSL